MRSVNRILVVGIALVCVAIYLYTSAPFMLWLDAPRFVAAIVTLGIALPAEHVYVSCSSSLSLINFCLRRITYRLLSFTVSWSLLSLSCFLKIYRIKQSLK